MKLTVKFYSVLTSFRVDARVDVSTWMNEQTKTCKPISVRRDKKINKSVFVFFQNQVIYSSVPQNLPSIKAKLKYFLKYLVHKVECDELNNE